MRFSCVNPMHCGVDDCMRDRDRENVLRRLTRRRLLRNVQSPGEPQKEV